MRSALAALLLLLSQSLFAAITVSPSQPQAGQPFQLTTTGSLPSTGPLSVAEVFFPGPNRIVITYAYEPCCSAEMPYEVTANIPALAAGEYHVTLRIDDGGVIQPFGSGRITVAGDAVPFGHAFPPVAGMAGGALVAFDVSCPPNDCSGAEVFFGSQPALRVAVNGSRILAVTPRSERAGPVDVRIRTATHDWLRHSAFMYVNANDYEKVLLPSLTDQELPGAFGSRWIVEHGVYNPHAITLEPYLDFMHVEWDCITLCVSFPTITPRAVSPVPTMYHYTREPNWIVHMKRRVARGLRWSLRVRDVSRQADSWGTALPVVRDKEFGQSVQIFDVPLRERFRQSLRIYALNEGLRCCTSSTVRFYSRDTNALLYETTVALNHAPYGVGSISTPSVGSPEFPVQPERGSLDGLSKIPELAGHDRVRIEIVDTQRRIWAYVSVTNNDTQQVTVVTAE
jgi:hypothetical protein